MDCWWGQKEDLVLWETVIKIFHNFLDNQLIEKIMDRLKETENNP